MSGLAELLRRLRDTPDGDGNLLDNSVVYTTTCVGLPWEHRMTDFPLLVMSKGGGLLRTDLHHRAAEENTSKVPFTLLKALQAARSGSTWGSLADPHLIPRRRV